MVRKSISAIPVLLFLVSAHGLTAASEPDSSRRPLVSAIRRDAWHGDRGMPGRAVEGSL